MTPIPCQVEADLDVRLGAACLRVRGAGSNLDVHLPAPWHWPRLHRARRTLPPLPETLRVLVRRAGLGVRLRYGPFRWSLLRPRDARTSSQA